jgi:hypothetical protein
MAMIQADRLTDFELRTQVHKLIIEEFGVSAFLRYVQTTYQGSGNWEVERQEILAGSALKDLVADVEKLRESRIGG